MGPLVGPGWTAGPRTSRITGVRNKWEDVETIGPYQLQKALGRGGTGVVFEAKDPSGRSVAVKTFTHPAGENPVLRERLLSAARAAGALGHPNLAEVIEAGEHHGRPFVVTELVEGVDLARALRSDRPLPMEWVLDVLRQIALGLAEAHRHDLLHLDLKPADVRVTREGDVKLLDFGVAHLKSIEQMGTGAWLHGIHYLAPEIIEGRRPDARADVFSVGALAFELAARRRAFPGEDATTVMLGITRGAPEFESLPQTLFSPRFEAVVGKSLARDPGLRYASAAEMHEDLVGLVRDVAERLRATDAAAGEEPHASLEIRFDDGPPLPAPVLAESTDPATRAAAAELETAVLDREVEQLCGLALAHAADGELAQAEAVAARIGVLAAHDPRLARLRPYLEEERGRRAAIALLASARDQLALGQLDEARALAEDALLADPRSVMAREIVERLSTLHNKPNSGPESI
jgi:Protein kinase domain